MGLPGCLFVCLLILLLVCFYLNDIVIIRFTIVSRGFSSG